MLDIEKLKFDENGLIPAIVVDSVSKQVLTLAYMNKESLKITMEKNLTCFWSRSRNELWLKGETSGNYQHVVSITADIATIFSPVSICIEYPFVKQIKNSTHARIYIFNSFSR